MVEVWSDGIVYMPDYITESDLDYLKDEYRIKPYMILCGEHTVVMFRGKEFRVVRFNKNTYDYKYAMRSATFPELLASAAIVILWIRHTRGVTIDIENMQQSANDFNLTVHYQTPHDESR